MKKGYKNIPSNRCTIDYAELLKDTIDDSFDVESDEETEEIEEKMEEEGSVCPPNTPTTPSFLASRYSMPSFESFVGVGEEEVKTEETTVGNEGNLENESKPVLTP